MSTPINGESALPLNRQVERYLRQMITEESYLAGALLPTEVELARKLGVARNTVRTAMDKLVREGLIVRKKGVGTQVSRAPIVTDLARWSSFTTELGACMKTLERRVHRVGVSKEVGRELGLLPGQEVCCLERLQGTDAEPMVLLISYFPREMNIAPDETFEGRLYQVLKKRYGVSPAESREEIGAMAAGSDLAQRLHLPHEVPVLYRKRRVVDNKERLIELAYAFYRADRFVYKINLPVEEKS